jgi:excinuclease ABC subunit B
MLYQLESSYRPRGDQSQAIAKPQISPGWQSPSDPAWSDGFREDFTIANVIRQLDRPSSSPTTRRRPRSSTRIGQFFPQNAVEYFVSYFDYYQPEAYIPVPTPTRKGFVDQRGDRTASASSSLLTRRDTIVGVSCIYGVTAGRLPAHAFDRETRSANLARSCPQRLVDMLYERNDVSFVRGNSGARRCRRSPFATADEEAVRLEFFGDELTPSHASTLSPATPTSR